jgi:hypothetical protein
VYRSAANAGYLAAKASRASGWTDAGRATGWTDPVGRH